MKSGSSVKLLHVGNEKTPIIIIDNFVCDANELIEVANTAFKDNGFMTQFSDYYPGIRKNAPSHYQHKLAEQLLSLLRLHQAFEGLKSLQIIMSAFSIATTPPKQLRPIQMLPHFDTPKSNQLAMVHYLCDESHGGTSFYRHESTGFETITDSRHLHYREIIKRQAMESKLHENPHYIDGDTRLFTRLLSVKAKMNRAVIYPSNILHSGNIKPAGGLSSAPSTGRLTISSFITMRHQN